MLQRGIYRSIEQLNLSASHAASKGRTTFKPKGGRGEEVLLLRLKVDSVSHCQSSEARDDESREESHP
jgi:hypothetical protein